MKHEASAIQNVHTLSFQYKQNWMYNSYAPTPVMVVPDLLTADPVDEFFHLAHHTETRQ